MRPVHSGPAAFATLGKFVMVTLLTATLLNVHVMLQALDHLLKTFMAHVAVLPSLSCSQHLLLRLQKHVLLMLDGLIKLLLKSIVQSHLTDCYTVLADPLQLHSVFELILLQLPQTL